MSQKSAKLTQPGLAHKSSQIERSKKWIFEALLVLLKEKAYENINISELTARAGVARATFYRNFQSKDDIILQYFDKILADCVFKINGKGRIFSLTIPVMEIAGQSANLKRLLDSGLDFLLLRHFLDWVNRLIEINSRGLLRKDRLTFRHKVIFLAGGFLQVIVDMIRNGAPDLSGHFTAEDPRGLYRIFENLTNEKMSGPRIEIKYE